MWKNIILSITIFNYGLAKSFNVQVYPTIPSVQDLEMPPMMGLDQQEPEGQTQLRKQDYTPGQLYASLFTNGMNFNLPLTVNGFKYNMTIDTGSSDFIIKGQNTPGIPIKRYKSKYEGKKKYEISFISAFLLTYEEDLPVQINGVKFETPLLVTYNGAGFKNTEGLLGLSYPTKAKRNPTFLQSLIQNKIVDKYAYGVNLNMFQPGRSFISFGEPDKRFYKGSLYYCPIISQHSIIVQFQSFQIGKGQKASLLKKITVLDTGASSLSFSSEFQDIVKQSFKSQNNYCDYYIYPPLPDFEILVCRIGNFDELPIIKFSVNKKTFSLPKQAYLRSCSQNKVENKINGNNNYYCQTYIKIDTNRRSRVSLGSPFFNKHYTYFDLDNHKVGIAPNNEKNTVKMILQKYSSKYEEKVFQNVKIGAIDESLENGSQDGQSYSEQQLVDIIDEDLDSQKKNQNLADFENGDEKQDETSNNNSEETDENNMSQVEQNNQYQQQQAEEGENLQNEERTEEEQVADDGEQVALEQNQQSQQQDDDESDKGDNSQKNQW